METVHIVIDMLYDFIDGSLACMNAEQAVKKSVEYINNHPQQKTLYICDCHPANHCSFKENGGIWPVHCVKGTRGGSIHRDYESIKKAANRPDKNNQFYKGCNSNHEQYSGYEAISQAGVTVFDAARGGNNNKEIVISGIATEYCVKETVLDFLKNGFKITLIKEALAYVDHQGHLATLMELGKAGVKLI